jgi:hypothetical protein
MKKSCKAIIEEILIKATAEGKTITEDELIKKLDKIKGFWEQAAEDEFDFDIIESEIVQ